MIKIYTRRVARLTCLLFAQSLVFSQVSRQFSSKKIPENKDKENNDQPATQKTTNKKI
jgi:hypothetical protein